MMPSDEPVPARVIIDTYRHLRSASFTCSPPSAQPAAAMPGYLFRIIGPVNIPGLPAGFPQQPDAVNPHPAARLAPGPLHSNLVQRQRIAERNQFGGALGAHNPGPLRELQRNASQSAGYPIERAPQQARYRWRARHGTGCRLATGPAVPAGRAAVLTLRSKTAAPSVWIW